MQILVSGSLRVQKIKGVYLFDNDESTKDRHNFFFTSLQSLEKNTSIRPDHDSRKPFCPYAGMVPFQLVVEDL